MPQTDFLDSGDTALLDRLDDVLGDRVTRRKAIERLGAVGLVAAGGLLLRPNEAAADHGNRTTAIRLGRLGNNASGDVVLRIEARAHLTTAAASEIRRRRARYWLRIRLWEEDDSLFDSDDNVLQTWRPGLTATTAHRFVFAPAYPLEELANFHEGRVGRWYADVRLYRAPWGVSTGKPVGGVRESGRITIRG